MTPTLELTFENIAGDPWEGQATLRFQGEPYGPFPVREGTFARQRHVIRWYIEKFMDLPEGGNLVRAAEVEAGLVSWGGELWEGLRAGGLSDLWLGAVLAAGRGRLELRAAKREDELAFRTPWELLRVGAEPGSPTGGRLLHQLGVTVVRRVKSDLPRLHSPDTSKGLRVLAIVCRPETTEFLDPRYTPEAILEALSPRSEVTIDFARPGTLRALDHALEVARQKSKPYHVVHFDGHGTLLQNEAGVGALCFEKQNADLDLVRANELGELLSRFNIPVVVLEACRTATQTFAQETVAGALLRRGVGTVLAMGYAVHVDMTRELMAAFYGGIAQGWPLGDALQHARNQLFAQRERRVRGVAEGPKLELQDWFVPQLYQGGEDPRLLPTKPSRRKLPPSPPLTGFHPAPRAGFQGRGRELHRLERALLRHRVVVVHAPGGMGKTTLAREAAFWWTRTGMFPGGALFVSFEGNPLPDRVVGLVGEALEGFEFHRRKDGAAWVEKQLRRSRMLLVWDNFESALPAFNVGRPMPSELAELAKKWTSGASRLLITCRDREVGFEAEPFPLGELSPDEGLLLLVSFLDKLGFGRKEREARQWGEKELKPIVTRVGGHPLALELLAPHIVKLGPRKVEQEVGELLAKTEQDSPEGRNRSMTASLDFSIRHLSEKARAALPAVALLAGGCVENLAEKVVSLEPDTWRIVREEFERTGMVQGEWPLFRPHPLLGEKDLLSPSALGGQDVATSGLSEQHFVTAVTHFALAFQHLKGTLEVPAALAAMAVTEVVCRRALDMALEAGSTTEALIIADSLKLFLDLAGRGSEAAMLFGRLEELLSTRAEEVTETFASAVVLSAHTRAKTSPAVAVRDLEALVARLRLVKSWDSRERTALALRTLGWARLNGLRRPAEAIQPLVESIGILSELEGAKLGSTEERAGALGDLAGALMLVGRLAEATGTAQEAYELNQARKDPLEATRSAMLLAQIVAAQGQYVEAESLLRRALAGADTVADEEVKGLLWQALGNLLLECERADEALDPLLLALAAFQRSNDKVGQVQALGSLGEVARSTGSASAALAWQEKSLALAEELGYVEGEVGALSNRAALLADQAKESDEPEKRLRLLREAVSDARRGFASSKTLGQPALVATSQNNLAIYLWMLGQIDEAEELATAALATRESLKSPDVWQSLVLLEAIAEARGNVELAGIYCRRKLGAFLVAQVIANGQRLPSAALLRLFELAALVRRQRIPLTEVLAGAGMKEPAAFFATVEQDYPAIVPHVTALAGGDPRPTIVVPAAYEELVDSAWEAGTGSERVNNFETVG